MGRQERREQTRSELVGAARSVFLRRGFHAASLDEIAAEAGFTKGAVYSNFAGKEDLFFAVYERRLEARAAELHRIADEAESAPAGSSCRRSRRSTRPR